MPCCLELWGARGALAVFLAFGWPAAGPCAAEAARAADAALAAGGARAGGAAVELRLDAEKAFLGNSFISLDIPLAEQQPRTPFIKNLRAGKGLLASGEDFILELGGGRTLKSSEFRLKAAREEPAGPSAKRLVLELAHEDLSVAFFMELKAKEWWISRWLEIQAAPRQRGGPGGQPEAEPVRLAAITLASWPAAGAIGPEGPGKPVDSLGYPSGCGQAVHAADLFFAIPHPAAENFAPGGAISCRIPIPQVRILPAGAGENAAAGGKAFTTPKLIIGAGERGGARRAFQGYIDATRPVPARMIFLVNDWYWKDKGKPLEAFAELARLKLARNVPIDSFTLDDGWDFDWDEESGIWGRLHRKRFPGGWEALAAIGRPAGIGVSLWFGPIGGYGFREKRIEFGRKLGFEVNGDKLCLSGKRYRAHVMESFSRWAERGMDYIKVDGFWPDCAKEDHGHPVGPAGAVAHMDSLMEVFAAWRKARPGLVIGYTSGSSPSPFWLQHADFVWRGGADDSHAGVGEPFDKHNTYLDTCLQRHRATEMPVSGFVTFDIVQDRIAGDRDEVFERNFWWLAARGTLHHDWYIQASDLTPARWDMLAKAARWAKAHEMLFRWSRMLGGDPGRGEVYGFSSFDEGKGTLALRNPSAEAKSFESTLASLLEIPERFREVYFVLKGVFGETRAQEGIRAASARLRFELPPLAIAVFEVEVAEVGPGEKE